MLQIYFLSVFCAINPIEYNLSDGVEMYFKIPKEQTDKLRSEDGKVRMKSITVESTSVFDNEPLNNIDLNPNCFFYELEDGSCLSRIGFDTKLLSNYSAFLTCKFEYGNMQTIYSGFLPVDLFLRENKTTLSFRNEECFDRIYLYDSFNTFLGIVLDFYFRKFKKSYQQKKEIFSTILKERTQKNENKYFELGIIHLFSNNINLAKVSPEIICSISYHLIFKFGKSLNHWITFLAKEMVLEDLRSEFQILLKSILDLNFALTGVFREAGIDETFPINTILSFIKTKRVLDCDILGYKTLNVNIQSFEKRKYDISRIIYTNKENETVQEIEIPETGKIVTHYSDLAHYNYHNIVIYLNK